MFNEDATILSSDPNSSVTNSTADSRNGRPSRFSSKKIIFWLIIFLVLIILAVGAYFKFRKSHIGSQQSSISSTSLIKHSVKLGATSSPSLPNLSSIASNTVLIASSSLANLKIEYLTFANFYQSPDNKITSKIEHYSLPLNVKVDVLNYYDISRKLDLDPGLNSLNNNGFALLDNPWLKSAPDFYAIYQKLNQKQIPILITSDFLLANYQNTLKKSFKDIEKNVFYNNLWDINKKLYTIARNRYEANLAKIGDVNNSVLEGERLEAAFFAVALELLKPQAQQISSDQNSLNSKLFSKAEANKFYFIVPPYLRDDVLAEEKLIRAANQSSAKSPVLLYKRNYRDFIVPTDYQTNAKLNNFYLTTRWLNSVFPLNYRQVSCPHCLLDQSDWRINLIAASLISQDFSLSPELKNKWARIYKVVSFFKGLREDLSYVNYRDALQSLFGAHYQIVKLFNDQNKQADINLSKFQQRLLGYKFPAILGAFNHNLASTKSQLGFRVLAESYWPNNYIFNHLTSPLVSTYLGTSTASDNITVCQQNNNPKLLRCNGFVLDPINLVYPINHNLYFIENTNYLNYSQEVNRLKSEMLKSSISHFNNYWTTLSLIKTFLNFSKSSSLSFNQSIAWQNRNLETAAAAWINLQLPLENLIPVPVTTGANISSLIKINRNSYIEPNLNLVNELLANNTMLLKMFSALQLDKEVSSASQNIKNFSDNLLSLRKIIIKELNNQSLSTSDNETIIDFTRQFKVLNYSTNKHSLDLSFPNSRVKLRESLQNLRLLVLIHQEGNDKVFSVGPIWHYQESH